MKVPFREFNVPNFDNIQSQLVPYIVSKYAHCTDFWNQINQQELFDTVPDLSNTISSFIGLPPSVAYLIAIPNNAKTIAGLGPTSLHYDHGTESCRLNWPILNSTSIETRLFTSDVEPTIHYLSTNEPYLSYHERDCNLIGSFRMTMPTLLRVHTIHGLYHVSKEAPLPRLVLSFKFGEDLEHLLE